MALECVLLVLSALLLSSEGAEGGRGKVDLKRKTSNLAEETTRPRQGLYLIRSTYVCVPVPTICKC